MIRSLTLVVCLLVSVCLAATSQASVMLSVSLTNRIDSASDVSFDIEATFSSLDSMGDPQLGDFVSSLLFGLEQSSPELLSGGPDPFERFSLSTGPWGGAVDALNGRIALDALNASDHLVHNTPLVLARLHINTVGLANDDYVVSLASTINFGLGTLDGIDNAFLPDTSILTTAVKFTVLHTGVVPEPGSMSIFGLGAVSILFGFRRRDQR